MEPYTLHRVERNEMPRKRQTKVGVVAIISHPTQPDKYLFTRKAKAGRRGLWSMPGGNVKYEEEPDEALSREVLEEVGLRIKDVGEPITTMTHTYDNGWHVILLVYGVTAWVGDVENPAPVKGKYSIKWLKRNDFPADKKLLPPLDKVLNLLTRQCVI
jgi:ADP-ribose pyrophosphatase YjhB (NUDIX family)